MTRRRTTMDDNKLNAEKLEKVTGADGISGTFKFVKCPYCQSSQVSIQESDPLDPFPTYKCRNCGQLFSVPYIK